MGPGEDIDSYWGHSALRISEPKRGLDITYGYGTFDFSTPHFYEKFVFGRLLYCLSALQFEDFMSEYQSSGQEVYQQLLNFTNKEKYQLIMNLQNNYKPENRWYRYDFLYDNCSSRIRDIIEKSVDGKVEYDSSLINNQGPGKNKASFRDLLSKSLVNEPWAALGINTMLGIGSDKTAYTKDYMFLPCYLMQIISGTRVKYSEKTVQLAGQPKLLLKGKIPFEKPNRLFSPETFFILIFVFTLLISYFDYRMKIYSRWFDIILYSVTGLIGLLFLIIWIGSLHKVMTYNINILWANPLNLIVAVFISLKYSLNKWLRYIIIIPGILFLLYIPCSLITCHHLYTVPLLINLILIIRIVSVIKKMIKFETDNRRQRTENREQREYRIQ